MSIRKTEEKIGKYLEENVNEAISSEQFNVGNFRFEIVSNNEIEISYEPNTETITIKNSSKDIKNLINGLSKIQKGKY